jgi:ParB-like chromosome segregation protein Spo0J
MEIIELDPNEIIIPANTVHQVDGESVIELMGGFRECGQRVPILVRQSRGHWYLVDGLQRLTAAKRLGIKIRCWPCYSHEP